MTRETLDVVALLPPRLNDIALGLSDRLAALAAEITELDALTPIFAQPDWFMGLLRWNGRNIRVVDTARLIMPERTAAGDGHRDRYQCVLMLDDSDWGLAVDSDAESIRLAAGDVRWRGNRTSRPWLVGTLAERLCALLDVRALTQHLREPQGAQAVPGVPDAADRHHRERRARAVVARREQALREHNHQRAWGRYNAAVAYANVGSEVSIVSDPTARVTTPVEFLETRFSPFFRQLFAWSGFPISGTHP